MMTGFVGYFYKMIRIYLLLFTINLSLVSKAQLLTDSIFIEGHYRLFHFNKPEVIKANASLLFILHGSGGKGTDMTRHTEKLEEKSAAENLLLVYPDGYKNYWNECRKASTAAANLENINEQAFFSGMIDYFKLKYKINTHRVFAAGFSGGGHMVYKLALTMPEKFRAVTAIVANLPDSSNMDCTSTGKAIPIMIINGTSDPVNPYNGGEVIIPNVKLGRVRSTDETFRYWRQTDHCTAEPVKELLPDTDTTDGKTIERYTCPKKGRPEVVLLKVINGKHDYPGDVDVYLEAWAFFKKQF